MYYNSLLTWYNSQIFQTTAASAFLDLPPIVQKDVNDVNDLIQCMNSTDIVQIRMQSDSPYRPSPVPTPVLSYNSIPAASVAPGTYHLSPTPAFGSSSAPVAVAPLPLPCGNEENDPQCEPIPVPVVIEPADHKEIHVGIVPANKEATKGKGGISTVWSTRNTRRKKVQ